MAKGSTFERLICTQLSLWWSHNESDDAFWRSSGSGARATSRFRRKGILTAGQDADLTAVDERGKPFTDLFAIEMKRGYKSWSVMDAVDKGARAASQTIEDFLAQACEAAERKNVFPVLIAQKDRHKAIIMVPMEAVNLLQPHIGNVLTRLDGPTYIQFIYQGRKWILHTLDYFLSVVTPEAIIACQTKNQ